MVNKVIQYLTITSGVLLLVLELVKAFEMEGHGEEKKKAVLDAIEMTYDEISNVMEIAVPKEYVLRIADRAIELAVRFYNLTGVFKKNK
jgi:hypothetical protein